MNGTARARADVRRVHALVLVGLTVVIAAIAGAFGSPSVSSSAASFGQTSPSAARSAGKIGGLAAGSSNTVLVPGSDGGPTPAAEQGAEDGGRGGQPDHHLGEASQSGRTAPLGDHGGALGEADGLVPDGASVFDDEIPAVANLDPSLLEALRRAATDAARDGVEFRVTSGWRSPAYQEQLLREAVAKYGAEKEAERWVATVDTSAHVSGDAVDIGPADAEAWLSDHGADYGLCEIYRNEPWHYELRPDATSRGCPPMYADPTHDPRMQR